MIMHQGYMVIWIYCIPFTYSEIASDIPDFLLFLPKSTFRVGVQLNVPLEEPYFNVYRGLLFRGDYRMPTFNISKLRTQGKRTNRSIHRWYMYELVEQALERLGRSGRACLLRAICEEAEVPMQHDGLLGALLHIFLTPSSSVEKSSRAWHFEYEASELWGKLGYGCVWKYASKCTSGALHHFTSLKANG